MQLLYKKLCLSLLKTAFNSGENFKGLKTKTKHKNHRGGGVPLKDHAFYVNAVTLGAWLQQAFKKDVPSALPVSEQESKNCDVMHIRVTVDCSHIFFCLAAPSFPVHPDRLWHGRDSSQLRQQQLKRLQLLLRAAALKGNGESRKAHLFLLLISLS